MTNTFLLANLPSESVIFVHGGSQAFGEQTYDGPADLGDSRGDNFYLPQLFFG